MVHSEISALISLIEDPDEAIYQQVRGELKSRGEQVIPQLEHFWELHEFGPLFHRRVEELINSIQYESVYKRLLDWRNSPEQDLLEGASSNSRPSVLHRWTSSRARTCWSLRS